MPRLMVVSLSAVVLLQVIGVGAAAQQGGATEPAKPAAADAQRGGATATPAAPAVPQTKSGVAAAVPSTAVAAAATSQPAPSAAGGELDPGTYGVRLRDLEQNVNELKEQIFRSKARLALLAETVLPGVVGGAQAHVVHDNRIGDSYKIVKVGYALDGAPLMNKADEAGALPQREAFEVFNGSITPGEHTLSVELELRGHGYGVFSYLKAYHFKLSSHHTFTAAAGKVASLRVISYEQGGPTTAFEQRPALQFVENVAKPTAPLEVAAGGL